MKSPLYLCGTTATGKSEVALALADMIGGEIVNADAYQIYQGLEILSAAPNHATRQRAPHHLYAALPLETALDAAHYQQRASPLIADLLARGKVPIITGGSGLYLKALSHRLSPLPASDPALRAELEERPLLELQRELRQKDPEIWGTFPPENKRYLIRALEICLLSGQKASYLKRDWDTLPSPPPRGILLERPKQDTIKSIERRAGLMLEQGAIEEVQRLLEYPLPIPTAAQAIGVREITAFLQNDCTREQCYERIVIRTRQYAKRQRTWFRKESWLEAFHPSDLDGISAYATL